jgi:AmmeMemoRadiSam system protein B
MKEFREGKIRSMLMAGIFYPDEAAQVRSELRSLGMDDQEGEGVALIVPHGAWSICGKIIVKALTQSIKTGIKWIVLLGAIHHSNKKGLFLSESDCFETPLGPLPVDRKFSEALASCSTLFELNDIPHLEEPVLESVLPCLKYRFPKASLIPLLMGGKEYRHISALAKALWVMFEPVLDETLFILSSNASLRADKSGAKKQAETFLSLLKTGDSQKIIEAAGKQELSACGASLAAALFESGLFSGRRTKIISSRPGHLREQSGDYIYYAGVVLK